jgi:hypothetical protein
MRKVRLLLALSALLVIGCRHCDRDDHHFPPNSTSILDVIVNGPCILVWIPSKPDVITLISPRDADGFHKVYVNSLTEGTDQNVHITLAPDGLEHGTKLPKLPIDPYFPPDFIANSIQWVPSANGYLMTIELPVPKEPIRFMSPAHPVTFENGTQSLQATNFVLEYKVKDFGKISVAPSQQNSTSQRNSTSPLSNVKPLSSSALLEQYAAVCGKADVRQHYYESCSDIRNLLEQCAGAKTKVLFFGVGIPLEKQIKMERGQSEAHAAKFFNLMLESFPDLANKRLLVPGKQDDQRGPSGSRPMLMEISFRPTAPRPRLLPANAFTAVIDCKAGNIIVTAATIKQ